MMFHAAGAKCLWHLSLYNWEFDQEGRCANNVHDEEKGETQSEHMLTADPSSFKKRI